MFRFNFFCLLTLYTCFARDPPTKTIPNQGTIQGKEISMIRTQRIHGYMGIPYAQPPLGHLRFAPPQIDPLPSWDGVKEATTYETPCLQNEKDFKPEDVPFFNLLSTFNKFNMSEDCLYLNVFVPYGVAPKDGFATMVWFHPGNFSTGDPSLWNPYTLVYKQRVIVVTFAYRMNIMGFFTTMDGEAPGNYGMVDQQAVLTWIKKNIKVFDGNPNNICLMGYGSGAVSIGLHLINPQSKGLFNKVILMSGNFLSPSAIKYPSEDKFILDEVAEYFGCFRTPTSALMECLRNIEAFSLLSFTSKIDWKPIIDQGLSNSTPPFLPELPRNFFERGEYEKVPILTGYTNMEEVLSIDSLKADRNVTDDDIHAILNEIVNKDLPVLNNTDCLYNYDHIMDSIMFFYSPSVPLRDVEKTRRLVTDFNTEKYYGAATFQHAKYLSKHKTAYVYRFDWRPNTVGVMANLPDWVSVPHLFDLIYVWGFPYWIQLPEQEWDTRDKQTSDIIMSFWTNFAKYTNPTENSLYPIRWDPFTKDDPGILIIDRLFNMSDPSRLNYKSFQFWNDYYPKVIELATQCCNATESSGNAKHSLHNYLELFIVIHSAVLLPFVGYLLW